MARKMHGRRRRRHNRVTWFVPRTSDTLDFAENSCWSNEDSVFGPVGATVAPRQVTIPIVTNATQAVSPDVDPSLAQHPLSEGWLLNRIRGSLHFTAGLTGNFPNTNTPAADLIIGAAIIHVGICRVQTLGDNWVIPVPSLNESCLADWLYLHHFQIATDNAVCHVCNYEVRGNSNTDKVGGYEIQSAITSSQVFGRPSMVDIDVDVKVKRRITTEHGIWMVINAEIGDPDLSDNFLFQVRPLMRALISKTV